MLSFEKAFEVVLNSVRRLGSERVDIAHALNRILAEDVNTVKPVEYHGSGQTNLNKKRFRGCLNGKCRLSQNFCYRQM